MATLKIAEACPGSHVTRSDGAIVREWIDRHWGDDDQMVLDFSGVRIASVSFFDQSLGSLARQHPVQELSARVRVANMDPGDRELLNRLVSSWSKEREAGRDEVVRLLRGAGVPDADLENWDGTLLALYQNQSELGASPEVVERLLAEKVARGEWTLDLGHVQRGLPREAGGQLKALFDERGIGYLRKSLRSEWNRGRKRTA